MQPEKILIFGPIIIFFVIFASMALGFLILVIGLVSKGRKMAWRGTLIDKLHNTKDEFDSNKVNHFYTLIFKTDQGKVIKVGVSMEMYEDYNVGDRAEKKSGELWQKKIN
jgi:hypothetical protein